MSPKLVHYRVRSAPINKSFSHQILAGFFRASRIALVTPLRDGMNLVAKEGPVVNQRKGVLVLSRTAGAFQQLAKVSIPTSPTDVDETAQALYTALMLPPTERRAKALLARRLVEQHDLNAWLTSQIDDINALLNKPVFSLVEDMLPAALTASAS